MESKGKSTETVRGKLQKEVSQQEDQEAEYRSDADLRNTCMHLKTSGSIFQISRNSAREMVFSPKSVPA